MARRAPSPSKKRISTRSKVSAPVPEVVEAEAPRRRRKPKSTAPQQVEPSLTDAFFPGGDETADNAAQPDAPQPAKARRGRKPKTQPGLENPAAMTAPPPEHERSELQIDREGPIPASPSEMKDSNQASGNEQSGPRIVPAPTSGTAPPAAHWDVGTGVATFDWPIIEQVAATDGPNQTMAKLLLAARAEGANSRWPF